MLLYTKVVIHKIAWEAHRCTSTVCTLQVAPAGDFMGSRLAENSLRSYGEPDATKWTAFCALCWRWNFSHFFSVFALGFSWFRWKSAVVNNSWDISGQLSCVDHFSNGSTNRSFIRFYRKTSLNCCRILGLRSEFPLDFEHFHRFSANNNGGIFGEYFRNGKG